MIGSFCVAYIIKDFPAGEGQMEHQVLFAREGLESREFQIHKKYYGRRSAWGLFMSNFSALDMKPATFKVNNYGRDY